MAFKTKSDKLSTRRNIEDEGTKFYREFRIFPIFAEDKLRPGNRNSTALPMPRTAAAATQQQQRKPVPS
jgi:hypothetical protein